MPAAPGRSPRTECCRVRALRCRGSASAALSVGYPSLSGSTKRAEFSPPGSEMSRLRTRAISRIYGCSDTDKNGSAFGDFRFLRIGDQWRAVLLDHVLVDDHLGHRLSGRV